MTGMFKNAYAIACGTSAAHKISDMNCTTSRVLEQISKRYCNHTVTSKIMKAVPCNRGVNDMAYHMVSINMWTVAILLSALSIASVNEPCFASQATAEC
eukprot:scaffold314874_cov36-Prasinocladus_malaysianus.AAC.1